MVNVVAVRGACLRRHVGAIVVVDNRIVTTGYNGPPPGVAHCTTCLKEQAPSGAGRELCPAVHAEVNAILQAAKFGVSIRNGHLICTLQPCFECLKMIINSGVSAVTFLEEYPPSNLELYLRVIEESGLWIVHHQEPKTF
jgi:dCMP deaminase